MREAAMSWCSVPLQRMSGWCWWIAALRTPPARCFQRSETSPRIPKSKSFSTPTITSIRPATMKPSGRREQKLSRTSTLVNGWRRTTGFRTRIVTRRHAAQPSETFHTAGSLKAGTEQIDYGHLVLAHTDGDIYVLFKNSNVLAVGDIASPLRDPALDYFTGAWIGGRLDAMRSEEH